MDELPPEYFGCYVSETSDPPAMPFLTHLVIETEYMAEEIAEAADRYYESLACN